MFFFYDAGEIYFSSIYRFFTKFIVNIFIKMVKFVDNFFEKHFIDMSFRMLFHSLCIKKNDLLCRKVKFKKRKILYIYLVSCFET
ncbi:hypothetical protein CON65_08600 [Bacillus pseudomycoides]|uniref:Uncharacterized protein n=1 Tax=Bacillus pseudomycoides TaxID=64104 RepID=A0AA91ZTW2_9BACI|nr:hypothetical protein COO03_04195 [Bacillus sp. AFS098217]PED83231.1 hypothetical protein CON65_08600 [Bacillus pseudomycoides]PEU14084.1 hypothetical protein CN524_11010 [Bacillus sp. AFS019443]PEU17598.1 hypothetical protein CN525_13950 [Bacillus sp. AFS014408]PFW62284.1 hypothetical protein COL20_13425 [Bacillus sp. AFS075034]